MEEPKRSKTLIQNPKTKQEPKNPFSLFPKPDFKIQLPFFPFNEPTKQEVKPTTAVTETPTPRFATFPTKSTAPVSASISTEAEAVEESSGGDTNNPIVLWQVYVLGGFIVLKWIWARWNDRKEKAAKKPSSDDEHAPDESESPVGDE